MPSPRDRVGMRHLIVQRLAEAKGAVVTHAALIAAVWGDNPPPWALGSLRGTIHRLRTQWGGIETHHRTGYRLRPESELARNAHPLDDRR